MIAVLCALFQEELKWIVSVKSVNGLKKCNKLEDIDDESER